MFLRNFRAESAQCWFFELYLIRVWLAPRKYNIKSHQTSLSQTIPKKGNAKECSNYHTIALISHAGKVMLKILQARLQQYVNHELPDVQAGFIFFLFFIFKLYNIVLVLPNIEMLVLEKAEEAEIKLPTSAGSWKRQESSRKTSISALLTMPKSLTVWLTINCGKFWKRWEYQTTWLAS